MYKVHEQVLGHNKFSISVNYNNSNFFFLQSGELLEGCQKRRYYKSESSIFLKVILAADWNKERTDLGV